MADQEKPKEKRQNMNKDLSLTFHVPAALFSKLEAAVAARQKQVPYAKVNRSDLLRAALNVGLDLIAKKEKEKGTE